MEIAHPIGATAATRAQIEAISPQFLRDGLLTARQKTWAIYEKARNAFEVGMTEADAREILNQLFAAEGVEKHWHRPWARFGPGTALTFFDALQPEYRLQEGDPVYMDLGPVWRDEATGLEYEGDVGATYVIGNNPVAERCAEKVKAIFDEAAAFWRETQSSGMDLYHRMKTSAEKDGYELLEKIDGHRISDYPHVKYAKNRLSELPFRPSPDLWILELQIVNRPAGIGAFYEDLLCL